MQDNAPGTDTPLGGSPDTLGIVKGNLAADQVTLQDEEATLDQDKAQLAQYTAQRDADAADFDPMGAAGPQPQFTEPTPQDHFQDVMKVAPLMMALGAVGGAFAKQHGITMLASTNAMMKGVVQGDADAYKEAREQYEQRYQEFRDKSKTWLDVYKAYASAYKGRIDADKLAVIGANNAVGVDSKAALATKADIARMITMLPIIDRNHQQVVHQSAEDVTAAIRAENDKQKADAASKNADSNASRAATAATKAANSDKGSQAASGEAVALIDKMLKQLDTTPGLTGIGGKVRRGYESVATSIDPSAGDPAQQFKTDAALLESQATAALKKNGQKMGADERRTLREGIDTLHEFGVSGKIAKDKLIELRNVLTKSIGTQRYQKGTGKAAGTYQDTQTGKVYKGDPPAE